MALAVLTWPETTLAAVGILAGASVFIKLIELLK
jgi:hypothetical protein